MAERPVFSLYTLSCTPMCIAHSLKIAGFLICLSYDPGGGVSVTRADCALIFAKNRTKSNGVCRFIFHSFQNKQTGAKWDMGIPSAIRFENALISIVVLKPVLLCAIDFTADLC